MLHTYFLNDFEMVPVAPIITGIAFVFTFHMRCISIVRSSYFRIFSASFLITFCPPKLQHLLTYYYYYYYTDFLFLIHPRHVSNSTDFLSLPPGGSNQSPYHAGEERIIFWPKLTRPSGDQNRRPRNHRGNSVYLYPGSYQYLSTPNRQELLKSGPIPCTKQL